MAYKKILVKNNVFIIKSITDSRKKTFQKLSKNFLTLTFISAASLSQKSVINKTLRKQSYKTGFKKQPDKTEEDLWLGKQIFLFRF
ncbi:MAG: hypothetical protein BGO86_02925 [Chryseobacterium sp. 36-9]|nr:MAG: hypothetical protein BGO86_02925 [Chryseobacterium sp. 36-9]